MNSAQLETQTLEIDDVLTMLPHKHPYLLIDRIVEREIGKRVIAHKAVTYSEDLFRGHFPDKPILPGAVIIEAASQAAGFLADLQQGMLGYVAEVKNFKFKKHVKPGNILELEVLSGMAKGPFLLAAIKAKVRNEIVAEGELLLYLEKKKKTTETV